MRSSLEAATLTTLAPWEHCGPPSASARAVSQRPGSSLVSRAVSRPCWTSVSRLVPRPGLASASKAGLVKRSVPRPCLVSVSRVGLMTRLSRDTMGARSWNTSGDSSWAPHRACAPPADTAGCGGVVVSKEAGLCD